MCGIAGAWGITEAGPIVARMLDAIAHRGPDGRGMLEFPGGAAGMVRLALVDLSQRGQQPLWSPDGRVAIIYNGEVYDHQQERERLRALGHGFSTTTDTEVVLAQYLEHDLGFVDRLRGMFALAIFDFRHSSAGGRPKIVLARDPFGMKPLYVGEWGAATLFASELKALVTADARYLNLDREALADYLAHGFVAQPRTILERVRMLEPGTIEVHGGERPPRAERFWRMPAYAPVTETLDTAAERLRATLEDSVRLHSFADARVGVFLSGGVDSAVIFGLMHRHVADLRSFTLRLPDSPFGDESAAAMETAHHFDRRTTLVEITGSDVCRVLPAFARDLDQPSTDGLNTWLISRAAASEIKGALSGLGGDEWFGGYAVSQRMRWPVGARARTIAATGRAACVVESIAGLQAPWRLRRLASRRSPTAEWLNTHRVFPWGVARKLAGLPARPRDEAATLEKLLERTHAEWRSETALGLACLLDVQFYMGAQLLRDSDAVTMAHSLELRLPLVDMHVAEFSRTCDERHKLGGQPPAPLGKRVLLRATEDVLPGGVARRKKRGFSLPIAHWLRTDLSGWVDEACGPDGIGHRGIVDADLVGKLYGRRSDPSVLYRGLWALLLLELWWRSMTQRVV
jgi:asparagine synthase (glutamine-hydrolysing)